MVVDRCGGNGLILKGKTEVECEWCRKNRLIDLSGLAELLYVAVQCCVH